MTGLLLAAILTVSVPFAGSTSGSRLPADAAFSVAVSGRSGHTVHLRVSGVPVGYIASFCTSRVCAPFGVTFALPKSGRASIELRLIKNAPNASKPGAVTLTADGARAISISSFAGFRASAGP